MIKQPTPFQLASNIAFVTAKKVPTQVVPKVLPKTWSDIVRDDKLNPDTVKLFQGNADDIIWDKPDKNKTWNFVENLWSGIGQSIASFWNLWKKAGMYVGNEARALFGKERLTPEQLERAWGENNIANRITNRQTPEQKASIWWKIGNIVWTVGQALVMPTGVGALSKVPAVASVSAKAPIISGMIKWWLQWAIGQEQYNLATEWRLSSPWELWLSTAVWAVIPWAVPIIKATKWAITKWVDKVANKVYLSWLLNPKKLEYVAKALKETGDDVANVTDWMVKRWVKWSKETIVNQLDDLATKTRWAVKDTVAQLQGTVKNPSIKWALEEMIDAVGTPKSASQIAKLDELNTLLQKHETSWLSRSETQKVKESMDDLLWIYTIAGDVRAWQQKADLAWLRQDIRKLIESAGDSAGIDIKTLNRDTAVAKQLSNSINYKSKTDAVREMLSPFAPRAIWWIFGATQWDTPEQRVMYWLAGFLWWQMLWSNLIKTNAWMLLKKAGWLMSKMTPQEKNYLISILWNGITKNSDNIVSNVTNSPMTYNSITDPISNLNDDLVWSINKKINAELDSMKSLPLKQWATVFPWKKWQLGNTKPQPKTPPVIRESGAIWQPYKVPKPIENKPVALKVNDSKPKVDTFNRLLELDTNKDYKKLSLAETNYKINTKWLETEYWTVESIRYDNKYIPIEFTIDWVKYPADKVDNFWKKLSPDEIKKWIEDIKASDAMLKLKKIEQSTTSKSQWSNLQWVLQELWISKVSEIPKWAEEEVLKMVRARTIPKALTTPAPKTNGAKPKVESDLATKRIESNPLYDKAKTYSNKETFVDEHNLSFKLQKEFEVKSLDKRKKSKFIPKWTQIDLIDVGTTWYGDSYIFATKDWLKFTINQGLNGSHIDNINGMAWKKILTYDGNQDIIVINNIEMPLKKASMRIGKVNLESIREQANKKPTPKLPKWLGKEVLEQDLYHATPSENVQSILKEWLKPSEKWAMGKAVYFTKDINKSKQYVSSMKSKWSDIIKASLLPDAKIYKYYPSKSYYEQDAIWKKILDLEKKSGMRDILLKEWYDGVEMENWSIWIYNEAKIKIKPLLGKPKVPWK